MLFTILIVVALVIAALLVVVATRPTAFRIERSLTIAAPPESAFAQVNDFRKWAAWSPYEKLDPQMKKTFEGPPSGTGSIYAWAGTKKVGEGRMTIEKSEVPSQISIKLEFYAPFRATNTGMFTFTPAPGGTKVTWAMVGERNFAAKAASLVMDIDKMVGSDFERGLAAIKALVETAPKALA